MQVKSKGLTLRVEIDESPLHPRRDFDNLGTMLCWHRRYDLGDKNPYEEPEDFRADKELQDDIFVIIQVYGLDHSGIRVSCSPFHAVDPGGWDSGALGFIYATKEDALKEYGSLSEETKQQVIGQLRSEVEAYDSYLTGDYYYFMIEGLDGECLDNCGSFSGDSFQDILRSMKEHAGEEYHPLFDKMLARQAGSAM